MTLRTTTALSLLVVTSVSAGAGSYVRETIELVRLEMGGVSGRLSLSLHTTPRPRAGTMHVRRM